MRRFAPLLLLLVLAPVLPAHARAQESHILVGGGLGTPFADLGDQADAGWQGSAGLQIGFPSTPVSLRADGGYTSFGEQSSLPRRSVLSGALSAVVDLPGVGLVPYFLAGVGIYHASVHQSGASTEGDSGFHGAFGVNIGGLGFGGYTEVRLVSVNTSGSGSYRYVTATIGIRL